VGSEEELFVSVSVSHKEAQISSHKEAQKAQRKKRKSFVLFVPLCGFA